MEIEFYHQASNKSIPAGDSYGWFFVMNNKVYSDNGKSCESQEATVDFEDFITERPDIGWRIK